jgi:hypothetical protein
MKPWNERTIEVACLLNPAFCGRLLYSTIKAYGAETKRPFPFALIYLVLPLLLHKQTREAISSKTQMIVWIQRNERLLIGFAERAKQLVPITNEAIEFLLNSNYIRITPAAEFELNPLMGSLSKTKYADDEIKACLTKSEHIARWFARAGKVETIFFVLGVRP